MGIGCTSVKDGCNADEIGYVFEDFKFIGEYPADNSYFVPSHEDQGQVIPEVFRPSFRYCFHLKKKLSTEELAQDVFPTRLRQNGFHILWYPRNQDYYAVPSIGDPIWSIQFEKNRCKAKIYNVIDSSLYGNRSELSSSEKYDYVLVIQSG